MIRSAAAIVALMVCGVTTAATINVPADYPTIQAAVDAASNGDEILVAPGMHTGTGDEVVDMRGKAITLRASGTPEETIIDGEGARRVVRCTSGEGADTVIEGFTITGGLASSGGGIYCSEYGMPGSGGSSPTITDCTISFNTANSAIYCYDSSSILTGCTISDNSGRGISALGNLTITDCTISDNAGGGVVGFNSTITGCTISGNTAGGGIFFHGGAGPGGDGGGTITDCTIFDNTATDCGGGVRCDVSGVTISGSTIFNNTANNGGGICGNPTITECEISGNTANDGGGIYGNSTITDCEISSNHANASGGGIYCIGGDPTITGCAITNNTASDDGGGIYSAVGAGDDSNPTLTDTVLCENAPDHISGLWTNGGGVCFANSCEDIDGDGSPDTCFDGVLNVPLEFGTVQEAIFAAGDGDTVLVAPGTYTGTGDEVVNTLGKAITIRASGTPEQTIIDGQGARRGITCDTGEDADTIIEGFTITGCFTGGGIYCDNSSPTITDCTITDNTASIGGGISCRNSSSPMITDCTITNNTATYRGGGIYCNGSDPTITNCTITNNTATSDGGGIYCNGSDPTITNCTITNNTATSDGGGIFCDDSSPTITGCAISDNTACCGGGAPGDYSFGGGIYCNNSSTTLTDTAVCGNDPDQINGDWTDNGGNCIAVACDSDGDGVFDCNDGCPNDPNKVDPGVCGCGVADTDSDDDGTLDCNDNCPDDPNKTEPGECGCGVADTADTDGDNTADCNDAFPEDPDEWEDSDGDGIGDNSDPCPYWAGDCSSDGHTLYVVPGDVIQDAIYGAVDGGVVELAPGTYYAPADSFENRVVVISGKSVTLHATGTAEETIIDGAGAYGGIVCNGSEASATVIDGLTITGCVAWEGGISCWMSSPTIINCTIIGNTATWGHGGGVSCSQSSPTITNCTITENTAEYGGGIGCQWSSYPVITDCTITNNTASMLGGGVSADIGMPGSNPIMSNTTICGNSPNQIYGPYSDEGGNSIDAVCEVPCDADTSGDGSVDGTDLTMIISLWGLEIPSADIDGDGFVGIGDLLILLESWGPCP